MAEIRNQEEAGPTWAGAPPSQQRAWWPVHQFVEAMVAQANYGPIPAAGTPSWCELADGDPRKLLSVAMSGEHHVLRVETAQEQMAEASHEIACAADWSAVAQRVRTGHGPAYIPRRRSA
ncbi:DUF2742 domain-containing protein [Mycobacterium marinum]|uniref:DUF2742 domain-containing protein n=1 Tax=Mycobacterium marinum TaxID=1781 RepID=UPI00235834DD|nr:DUF2742 domain-containing protein [Mycobacterium marinum]MDC8982158.1 DUF2742 domain-containing protein [Mycobacterium marinum]MDC8998880.1 DUF2742 domain-containing protein [Mycobacterium marinum]MDC9009613.1 DUF2742 domain-containing protein [Mycobacterium marinum]